MFFTYLTRCFWINIFFSAVSLLADKQTSSIVFALFSISFAILLHAAMREE